MYVVINGNRYRVGDPITEELVSDIIGNVEDHEQRILDNETTGGSVFVINEDIGLAGLSMSSPFIRHYKCPQDLSITDFRVQIFDKGVITVGHLKFDLQKSTDTNNANFNSILTSEIDFDYSGSIAYSEQTGLINSGLADFAAGDVLRVEVTSLPTNFGGKILLTIGAE